MVPKRIQRKRTKGWRMPPNTVYVGRPTCFGNPFTERDCREAGYTGDIRQRCVDAFRAFMGPHWRENWQGDEAENYRGRLLSKLESLRGKNLACWCKIGDACHADVLLEIANR